MKKIINNIFVLILLLVLTSCNDWLNVSPKADMKAEDLFEDESGFRDALIGVYALMSRDVSYGRNLTYGYLDVLAQYYESPHKLTTSGYPHNFKEAAEFNYTESSEERRIVSIWSNHFTAIANINLALEFIDRKNDVFSTSDVYEVFKGEFLALRAFLHFDMLRLYAPSPAMNNGNGLQALAIPYVEKYTNVAQPQLTVEEVLKSIKRDLISAKTLMKDKEIFEELESFESMYNREQRMNYFATTALLARVYLYGNEKNLALTEAKEIIGEVDGINPTSYQLTDNPTTTENPMFKSEIIFSLDVQKLKDLTDLYFQQSFSSTSYILTLSSAGKENIFNSSELDNEFRNGWLNVYTDGNSYVLAKYKDVKYIPMFKISELYLIAAESTSGTEAYAYLNKLRYHRGLSSIAPTEDLEEAIFKEYRREFIGEGQMFYYYKRKLFEVIGASDNIAIDNLNAVYNLPLPKDEIEFGNIK